ncbi:hypothetical protein QBC37DRAFT_486943 [Rhypophila decipiens]|uniref:DUF7791 domain-containing protein n=1 Tax=Rhypophila decipiens TaxID=261697 RepID=A0AAN6XX82_9PEZI|nr:hypothetical protein QBC37DRAFT_486943 [Rhypophila decipiens]
MYSDPDKIDRILDMLLPSEACQDRYVLFEIPDPPAVTLNWVFDDRPDTPDSAESYLDTTDEPDVKPDDDNDDDNDDDDDNAAPHASPDTGLDIAVDAALDHHVSLDAEVTVNGDATGDNGLDIDAGPGPDVDPRDDEHGADEVHSDGEHINDEDFIADNPIDNHGYGSTSRPEYALGLALRDWLAEGDGLRDWAGPGNKLGEVCFFFGLGVGGHRCGCHCLRRRLLHDMLFKMPDEIPRVFPALWRRLDAGLATDYTPTDQDIRVALDHLIRNAHAARYRFCFFIDALDQVEDDAGVVLYDLAELLPMWVNESRGAVKMCVSSRELPVFMDQLYPARRIRLQDFTEPDMWSLVRQTLQTDPQFGLLVSADPEDCQYLISSLVDRSEGVFLWLGLVLPKITRALRASSRAAAHIWRILETIPNELQDMFSSMHASIREEHRQEAYSAGSLLRLETRVGKMFTLSLLGYSLLAEILESDDPEYAINYQPKFGSEQDLTQRLEDASRRLRVTCCGLLELRPYYAFKDIFAHLSQGIPAIRQHIKYTHHTVPEILHEIIDNSGKNNMPCLQDVNIIRLAINKLILRVKCIPFPNIPSMVSQPNRSNRTLGVDVLDEIWSEMLKFMDGLVLVDEISVVLLAISQLLPETQHEDFFNMLDHLDEALRMTSLDIDWVRLFAVDRQHNGGVLFGRFPVVSLLHLAAAYGRSAYVWWRIDQRPGWLDHAPNRSEFLRTIPQSWRTAPRTGREAPGLAVLEGLFDPGLSVWETATFWLDYYAVDSCGLYNIYSLWSTVIVTLLHKREPFEDEVDAVDLHWDMCERFLRRGADPRVYFEGVDEPADDYISGEGFIYSDNERFLTTKDPCLVNFTFSGYQFTTFLSKRPSHKCCLRDFIEFIRPWNCASILEIIDAWPVTDIAAEDMSDQAEGNKVQKCDIVNALTRL